MKNVQRLFFIVSIMWIGMFLSLSVYAGPFTDEMSKCIVTKTTESDRTLLVQWIYAAISSHPDVEPMSNISPKVGEDLNKRIANLVTELLTVRCKKECQKAVEFEGANSIKASFETLGKVAVQSMMSHPKVKKFVSIYANYLDKEKFKKAFRQK